MKALDYYERCFELFAVSLLVLSDLGLEARSAKDLSKEKALCVASKFIRKR